MKAIAILAKFGINLIYPLHCAYCKKRLNPLDSLGVCPLCIAKIKKNPKPYCVSCGRSVVRSPDLCPECRKARFSFKTAHSACIHEGILKELIHLFKYKGRLNLSNLLSGLMIDFIKENDYLLSGVDAVTFVPIQRRRIIKRGFNQSGILARDITKAFGLPLLDILKKVRKTKPQNELSRDDRLNNLNGAIRVNSRGRINGLKILLIDDVMATGATLDESAKALLSGGAKEVRCLTLSRGI